MALDQLAADAVADILKIKAALLLLDAGMVYHLKQHISQLLLEQIGVVQVDRLAHLVCFLDHIPTHRRVGLLSVPWTALLTAQDLHNPQQVVDAVLFLFLIRHAHVTTLLCFGPLCFVQSFFAALYILP